MTLANRFEIGVTLFGVMVVAFGAMCVLTSLARRYEGKDSNKDIAFGSRLIGYGIFIAAAGTGGYFYGLVFN